MAASKYGIRIEQGATYEKEFIWKAGDPAAPVDLTGCTAKLQIRETVSSPNTLLSLSTDNARIVLGGTAGTITLKLTAVETAALVGWVNAVYDLEITFTSGFVRRLLQGSVKLSPEVTRA